MKVILRNEDLEEKFQGFPNNFFEPHIFLKIFSFLEFKDSCEYCGYKGSELDYYGYFSFDQRRQIWFLFPTIIINRDENFGERCHLISYQYLKKIVLKKTKQELFENLLSIWKESDACLLKEFVAKNCCFNSPNSLYSLPSNQLEGLELYTCQFGSNNKSLSFPHHQFPKLRTLVVMSDRRSDVERKFAYLYCDFFKKQNWESLKKLKLGGHKLEDRDLGKLSKLESLDLFDCEISLNFLNNLVCLQSLKLEKISDIDGNDLLETLPRLKILKISKITVLRNFPFSSLKKCLFKMERLEIESSHDGKWEKPQQQQQEDNRTCILPNLKFLSLKLYDQQVSCVVESIDIEKSTNLEILEFEFHQSKPKVTPEERKMFEQLEKRNILLPESVKELRIPQSDYYTNNNNKYEQNNGLRDIFEIDENSKIENLYIEGGMNCRDLIQTLSKSLVKFNYRVGFSKYEKDWDSFFAKLEFPNLRELVIDQIQPNSGTFDLTGLCWFSEEKPEFQPFPKLETLKLVNTFYLKEDMFSINCDMFFPSLKTLVLGYSESVRRTEIFGERFHPSFGPPKLDHFEISRPQSMFNDTLFSRPFAPHFKIIISNPTFKISGEFPTSLRFTRTDEDSGSSYAYHDYWKWNYTATILFTFDMVNQIFSYSCTGEECDEFFGTRRGPFTSYYIESSKFVIYELNNIYTNDEEVSSLKLFRNSRKFMVESESIEVNCKHGRNGKNEKIQFKCLLVKIPKDNEITEFKLRMISKFPFSKYGQGESVYDVKCVVKNEDIGW